MLLYCFSLLIRYTTYGRQYHSIAYDLVAFYCFHYILFYQRFDICEYASIHPKFHCNCYGHGLRSPASAVSSSPSTDSSRLLRIRTAFDRFIPVFVPIGIYVTENLPL